MGQKSPPRRRALIVEDDYFIALDLEFVMADLGFDVCLAGGREGIETARWLREVCGASIVFVTAANDRATAERIRERVPGAPVVSKPVYPDRLAGAVASAGRDNAQARATTA